MEQQAMLLSELRQFRDEFKESEQSTREWQEKTSERVKALEVYVKDGIAGNGQPSRLAKVEAKVEQLMRFRYWLAGVVVAITVAIQITWQIFKWVSK